MSSNPTNSRASLLAGLRTGGVRSTSTTLPHTAAPGASFNLSRFPAYPEEDHQLDRSIPMTAALDGSNIPFSHQQHQLGLNPNSVPFSPALFNNQCAMPQNQLQNQAFQLQLLQLEMIRIQSQALQAQQLQAELIARDQRQQKQQQQFPVRDRRASLNQPATAGPHVTAFDLRSATLSAQMRRANQSEQLRAQHGLVPAQAEDQVPMTAALGGRFGGRVSSAASNLSRYIIEEPEELSDPAPPPKPIASSTVTPMSRSDQVANWRRGGNGKAIGGSFRAVSSPAVKITPPPADHTSASGMNLRGGRPQRLNIIPAALKPLATVAIGTTTAEEDDADGSASSIGSPSVRSARSDTSSPVTPPSSATNHESQLSPREEATKKLYEGLGIGRPVPPVQAQQQTHSILNHRMVSQPMRQPRGPPSGADELGPKNFATRIRRQAIGGLEMLMGARERKESFIEVY